MKRAKQIKHPVSGRVIRARKIGHVYEIPHRCGHAMQHTLLIPATPQGLRTLRRAIDIARALPCDLCLDVPHI